MTKTTKITFIPARYIKDIKIPVKISAMLPERMMLFSSVQFLHQLPDIAKQLESTGKKVLMVESSNFLYEGMKSEAGQLLGCNSEIFDSKNHGEDFDAFLYIGDGTFHPQALMVNNHKDIYCYNPKSSKLDILKKELHESIQKRRKGSTLKFLSSKNIGMIISTKRGQCNKKRAQILIDKISKRWPEKKLYTFICNDIDFQELENFNFIDIYINTACSRIGHDDTIRSPKPIVNMDDIEVLLKD